MTSAMQKNTPGYHAINKQYDIQHFLTDPFDKLGINMCLERLTSDRKVNSVAAVSWCRTKGSRYLSVASGLMGAESVMPQLLRMWTATDTKMSPLPAGVTCVDGPMRGEDNGR